MNSIIFNKRIEGPFKETYKGYNQYIFTGDIDDLFLMDPSELGINRKLCRIEDAFAEYGKKEKYDIVTAAGCINWVDEKKFMDNMAQVLKDKGVIVIYDFGITDRMAGNDAYTEWYQNEYLKRFPKPPRKEDKWTQDDLPKGFVMEKQTEYDMEYPFKLDAFVDFMLIQSNVNAQIECGKIAAEQVYAIHRLPDGRSPK